MTTSPSIFFGNLMGLPEGLVFPVIFKQCNSSGSRRPIWQKLLFLPKNNSNNPSKVTVMVGLSGNGIVVSSYSDGRKRTLLPAPIHSYPGVYTNSNKCARKSDFACSFSDQMPQFFISFAEVD